METIDLDWDWMKSPEFIEKYLSPQEFRKAHLNEWKSDWPSVLFIVAQNFQQARDWARENNCPKEVWRYVFDYETFRGVRDIKVLLLFIQDWNSNLVRIGIEVDRLISDGRAELWDFR